MPFLGKAVTVIQGIILLPRPTLARYVIPFLETEAAIDVVKRVLATVHLVAVQLEIAAQRKQVVLADAPVKAESGLVVDGRWRGQNGSGCQFIVKVALVIGDRAIGAVIHKTLWARPIVGGHVIAEDPEFGELIIYVEATIEVIKRHRAATHRHHTDTLFAFFFQDDIHYVSHSRIVFHARIGNDLHRLHILRIEGREAPRRIHAIHQDKHIFAAVNADTFVRSFHRHARNGLHRLQHRGRVAQHKIVETIDGFVDFFLHQHLFTNYAHFMQLLVFHYDTNAYPLLFLLDLLHNPFGAIAHKRDDKGLRSVRHFFHCELPASIGDSPVDERSRSIEELHGGVGDRLLRNRISYATVKCGCVLCPHDR